MEFDELSSELPSWAAAIGKSIANEDYDAAKKAALAEYAKCVESNNGIGKVHALLAMAKTHLAAQELHDAKELAEKTLEEIVKTPDKKLEACSMHVLAKVMLELCVSKTAVEFADEAVGMFKAQKSRAGEASGLCTAALAYLASDKKQDALKAGKEALAIFKELDEKTGEAMSLKTLVAVGKSMKKYEDALRSANEVLGIYEGSSNIEAEGSALLLVADVRMAMGEHEQAKELASKAADNFHMAGDTLHKAGAVKVMATACYANEDAEDGGQAMQEAVELYRLAGFKKGEAETLCALAEAHINLGNYSEGIAIAEEGIATSKKVEVGGKVVMANLYNVIATGHLSRLNSGQSTDATINWKARAAAKEALAVARDTGDKKGSVRALHTLAGAFMEYGNFAEAKAKAKAAVELCQDLGDKKGEGHNLLLIAQMRTHDNKDEAVRLGKLAERLIKESGDLALAKEATGLVDEIRDFDSKKKGKDKGGGISADVQSEKTDYTLDLEYMKIRACYFDGFVARAMRARR